MDFENIPKEMLLRDQKELSQQRDLLKDELDRLPRFAPQGATHKALIIRRTELVNDIQRLDHQLDIIHTVLEAEHDDDTAEHKAG